MNTKTLMLAGAVSLLFASGAAAMVPGGSLGVSAASEPTLINVHRSSLQHSHGKVRSLGTTRQGFRSGSVQQFDAQRRFIHDNQSRRLLQGSRINPSTPQSLIELRSATGY